MLRRILPRHLIKLLPLVRWFEQPRLCAGTEDFHARLEDSRLIERTSQNDSDSGHRIDIGNDAGTTFRAEAAMHEFSGITHIIVGFQVPLNLNGLNSGRP